MCKGWILKKEDFRAEFQERRKDFETLRTTVYGLISKAISEANVSAMPIISRVKCTDSAVAKFDLKNYTSPFQQMTDILGFRVVLYLEHEIGELEKVLRKYFEIDEQNSIDKRKPNDVQTVGYRSLHLICKLGKQRQTLPEYIDTCDFSFEIQVRTVLEHAWAEIEHKQKYKSKIALPTDLQRRLNILSGNLELIDRELSRIVEEVSIYKSKIQHQDRSVKNDFLSVTSLISIARSISESQKEKGIRLKNLRIDDLSDDILDELSKYGIQNIGQLEGLLNSFFDSRIHEEFLQSKSFAGLVRSAMIWENFDKYISNAYWGQYYFPKNDLQSISKALNVPNLQQKLQEVGADIRWKAPQRPSPDLGEA